MRTLKQRSGRLGFVVVAAFATLVLGLLLVPRVYLHLVSNMERLLVLRRLELTAQVQAVDELAWDAGWRSLCSPGGTQESVPVPASDRSASFVALASIDQGDYAAAKTLLQRLVEQGQVDETPNGPAYLAALNMDWVNAAQAYQPQATTRHQRWWGTVFYLAAQTLMFEGKMEDAADLYRQADAAYGMYGPYLGLGLVECLVEEGRTLEAWDAYRRALVMLPVEEALMHLPRFNELRLEGLRAWLALDPDNAGVAHWLAFYDGDSLPTGTDSELLDVPPQPQVVLDLDLGDAYSLIGFDYRTEDLETGPFMQVDLFMREGQGDDGRIWRMRRTVLNQTPNGSFVWDAVPDGVRPVGWHGLVYSHDLDALVRQELLPGDPWQCLDAGRIGSSFGLQSNSVPLPPVPTVYVQGGEVFLFGDGSLSLGRRWFGIAGSTEHSYVPGGRKPDSVEFVADSWQLPDGAHHVAVWLLAHQTSKGCFRGAFLFSMPPGLEP
jgi:tetratricopeptide (TPR) repeat protein